MSDEGESTGIMTSLAGTLVRFSVPWAGEALFVHPAVRQKTRMPDIQMAKKIPARYVFVWGSTVFFIRCPRD
jgi:hypothetical protein